MTYWSVIFFVILGGIWETGWGVGVG